MVENVQETRRKHVEKLNGWRSTWWHYNRMTLVITLTAIATLFWHLQVERVWRQRAEAELVRTQATSANLSCYNHERATSLLIAGGSQRLVNDALIAAASQADTLRLEWLVREERRKR